MDVAAFWYFPVNASDEGYYPDWEQSTPELHATKGSKLPDGLAYTLTASLLSRPSVEALQDAGILRPPVDFVSAKLSPKLEQRPSQEEVHERGFLKSNIEVVGQRLARRSLSDALSRTLERRPTVETLQDAGKLRAPMELVGARLSTKLEKRPTQAEVHSKGVLKSNVEAVGERLTRVSLEGTLSKELARRPSVEVLKQRGIVSE